MHDNDAAGRELLTDVRTLVELLNDEERAATPEEQLAARDALQIEGARQWFEAMERNRRALREHLACDAILRASAEGEQ